MQDVVVFHGAGCHACHDEMVFLSRNGVVFTAKDVVVDQEARSELLRLGSRTLPTTVIDGRVVIGFDKELLSELLGIGRAG